VARKLPDLPRTIAAGVTEQKFVTGESRLVGRLLVIILALTRLKQNVDIYADRRIRRTWMLGPLWHDESSAVHLRERFPYATLSINVGGSFMMGFLFVETLERLTVPPALRAGILTGFIGGYTTFSTFEMEILLLVEQGAPFKALFYTLLSVILGFAAAFGGAYIARSL
jgi:CrcB protein